MLVSIALILGILWILGFTFNVGGGLIHILLVVILVLVIARLID